jgi:hypothetical protein
MWYKKYIIVEIYYCKVCGVMETARHSVPHFKDNEHYGFMVFHQRTTDRVFVIPTYSDEAVTVEQGMRDCSFADDLGWLFVGSTLDLYNLASTGMSLHSVTRRLQTHDHAFEEVAAVYARYIQWYNKNYMQNKSLTP